MKNQILDIKIDGIPCKARILTYHVVKGDPTTWASDLDYYGYTELEYELYDRKRYRGYWLDRIIEKKNLENEIRNQILTQLEVDYED